MLSCHFSVAKFLELDIAKSAHLLSLEVDRNMNIADLAKVLKERSNLLWCYCWIQWSNKKRLVWWSLKNMYVYF